MVTQVFFSQDEEKFLEKFSSVIGNRLNGSVAIKLHMGEPGNNYFLKPAFVKKIVDILKNKGVEPFLFDSPVVYDSPRNSVNGYLTVVAKHGFTEDKIGCPVVVSDDYKEQKILVDDKEITFQVCKGLVEADGVLVLSHVKGHMCSGFGASIKNLGMGALTKETKGMIHAGGEPVYISGCTLCGLCSKNCPTDNIRYDKDKTFFKKILKQDDSKRPFFDKNWCCGCSNCAAVCPQKSIRPKMALFNDLLSAGALAALKNFKKSFFVNVAKDVTKLCDCMADPGPMLSSDVGYLMSEGIACVDKAAYDLVVKQMKKDVFKEANHISPLGHLTSFSKLSRSSLDYKIIRI
ncbi:DUF362 domain-containing protein [Candidatus Woesearchaeota archaeon]|nr:DUF362 domain-containing protein [Candidatus Woesearchaeota archaeon]